MRLTPITWCVWILCGVALFLFATDLWLLWALWLVCLGILLGKALSLGPAKPEIVAAGITLLVFGTLLIRSLPVYSLGWDGSNRMTITKLGQDWKIEISDPGDIETFKTFAKLGRYETLQKSGYGYHVYVGDGQSMTGYYVHGDCIGNKPGGFIQTVFVPRKRGFRQFFENVLLKNGHEIK